jgi:hypothetical protein
MSQNEENCDLENDYQTLYEPLADQHEYSAGIYPLESIISFRNYLINELKAKQCKYDLEMNLKRKCGILTHDVIEYFLSNKRLNPNEEEKTTEFKNDLPDYLLTTLAQHQNQPEIFIKYSIDDQVEEEEEQEEELEKSDLGIDESFESGEIDTDQQHEVQIEEKNAEELMQKLIKENAKLSQELKLRHACCENETEHHEKQICPRLINNSSSLNNSNKKFFMCDFCFSKEDFEHKMLEHLLNLKHYSASEYYSIDSNSNQYELSKRCSVKSFNQINKLKSGIFCPKCDFFFEHDIQACALHYFYIHDSSKSHFIYSVYDLNDLHELQISKEHSCPTCMTKFKKLTELVTHLEKVKHFPHAQNEQQINVFHCSLDKCTFKSTNFFAFKTHILSHSHFNKQQQQQPQSKITNVDSVKCKVEIYTKSNAFFHMTNFQHDLNLKQENLSELEAIDSLLEMTKQHTHANELYKDVRARKDQLIKLAQRKFCFQFFI